MRRSVVAATLAVLALAGDGAAAETRRCGSIGFTPNSDDGAFAIRATGTTCRTARAVARASREHGVEDPPDRYTARGFTCRGRYVERELTVVLYRCTRGRATVRFDRT